MSVCAHYIPFDNSRRTGHEIEIVYIESSPDDCKPITADTLNKNIQIFISM